MSCSNDKTILLKKDYRNQDVVCQLSIMSIKQTEIGTIKSRKFQVNFFIAN
jgi:hypothetical protein